MQSPPSLELWEAREAGQREQGEHGVHERMGGSSSGRALQAALRMLVFLLNEQGKPLKVWAEE